MTTKHSAYPALVMPANVQRRTVAVWSNGVALDADLYEPRDIGEKRLPGIVLSHGWGGTKATCERYAALFASAGFLALTFTHRGWGESGGVAREIVDPLEWTQGFRSAVDYLEGEPSLDPDRIGAWGTSYGGGIATYSAATDERIKVLAVQVAMVSRLVGPGGVALAKQRAKDLARGRLPEAIDAIPGLPGGLHLAHALQYDVVENQGDRLRVPTLLMDAENEGFFDKKDNCLRLRDKLSAAGVPVSYRVIRGIDHYGIYFDGYEEGSASALAWFREHL